MTTETNSSVVITEPQEMKIIPDSSSFGNKASFEHAQRVAMMLSKSELIPTVFQNKPENVMIALELSNRISASPLMVMQNLYIVHGKPAWSSQFLIATLNASGKFSPLRYEHDDQNGGRCRAYAKEKATGDVCHGTWVSIEMAKAEGWMAKNGSKWKTMPELMMRYRAAAFFTRQFAPEISMGIATFEEAVDITPPAKVDDNTNEESNRFKVLIEKADSLESLNNLRKHLSKYPEHNQAFLDQETLLKKGSEV